MAERDDLSWFLKGPAADRLRESAELQIEVKRAEALEKIEEQRQASADRRAALTEQLHQFDGEFIEVDSQWAELDCKRRALLAGMQFARSELERMAQIERHQGRLKNLGIMREVDTAPLRRLAGWIDEWGKQFPDMSSPSPIHGTQAALEGNLIVRMAGERLDDLRLTSLDPGPAVEAFIAEYTPKLQELLDRGWRQKAGAASEASRSDPVLASPKLNGDHW